MRKTIFILFAVLLFFVPLVLWPFTSEVFEFNKMVLTYALTTLIVGAWTVRCIIERKFIFRRTILDIPLLFFLGSQIISTFLSIDFYTSVFGYYSRFNGGLLSTIAYLLLYWAFVSNLDRRGALAIIRIWLISAVLVAIYGVLEHFGIDKKIWVQDVESRVFSTLGQPNWLAAWVVALIPLTWALAIESSIWNVESKERTRFKIQDSRFVCYSFLSILLFITLLFTKSRSGLAGFIVADLIFWGFAVFKSFKENMKPFVIYHITFIILALVIGTQFSPSITQLFNRSDSRFQIPDSKVGTALETGGTESGAIRKIVWKGAVDLWLHYPVFGTGVETFAYSYYMYRPAEHNLTSEWNFIYNKAHNEFLNMASNSGAVGLLSYLVLIGFITFTFIQKLKITDENSEFDIYNLALLCGFISLSVSNFFGFSVVPTQLQFFLFPAIAIALADSGQRIANREKIEPTQKVFIALTLITTTYTLYAIFNYWYSDTLYTKAKAQNSIVRPDLAIPLLTKAIEFEPYQSLYHSELANSLVTIALAYAQEKNSSEAASYVNASLQEIQKSDNLSPNNLNIKRMDFTYYVRLSSLDPRFLILAQNVLTESIKAAPTDARLYYNLAIIDMNLKDSNGAEANFKKAIELKGNYEDAKLQYANFKKAK